MKCCSNCFGDPHLRKQVVPTLADGALGKCSYCGSEQVQLVAPSALKDFFAPVLAIYDREPNGSLLVELLKTDWGLFDNGRLSIQEARSLLNDVIEDGQVGLERFVISPRYSYEGLHVRWDQLRDELIGRNRYFPDAVLEPDELERLLSLLGPAEVSRTWFRARIQHDAEVFAVDKMGAPPKHLVSHGRANPAGIPYLYVGSTEATAVAEIRPHTGETVCVAEFLLDEGLQLIDLRDPRRLISPFVYAVEDQIAEIRSNVPLLERLGQELTKPVVPHRAAIDYVPSQYLCEFIKKTRWDGVIYSSSVSDGFNLALFDPVRATAQAVSQRHVARVDVTLA